VRNPIKIIVNATPYFSLFSQFKFTKTLSLFYFSPISLLSTVSPSLDKGQVFSTQEEHKKKTMSNIAQISIHPYYC